jgi:hypothetical protein
MARRLAGAVDCRDLPQLSRGGATTRTRRGWSTAAATLGGPAEGYGGAMANTSGVHLHLRYGVHQVDR